MGSLFVTVVEVIEFVFSIMERLEHHQPFKTIIRVVGCCLKCFRRFVCR